jgi:hypothetical protein
MRHTKEMNIQEFRERQEEMNEQEKEMEEQKAEIINLISSITRADIIAYLHIFITGKLQGVNLEREV